MTKLRLASLLGASIALTASSASLAARDTYVLERSEGDKAAEMQFYKSVPRETEQQWRGEVDLFGIGSVVLQHKSFVEKVGDLAPEKGSAHFLVRLGFTARGAASGRTSSCEVLDTNYTGSADASQRLCDAIQAIEFVRVRTRRGFDWGADKGFLTLDIALYRAPMILRPFTPELGRKGVPVEISMPFSEERREGLPTCYVHDQRVDMDEQQPLCELYERQLKRSGNKSSDGETLERWQRGIIYLRQTADRSQYREMVSHRAIGPSGYNAPIYEAIELDPEEELTSDLGELRFRRESIQYPERAKKTDVTGRTTIILRYGRDSERRPISCRVLESSGSSVLDNASCVNALRNALWLWKGSDKSRTYGWIKVPVAWSLNGRIGSEMLPGFERGKPADD